MKDDAPQNDDRLLVIAHQLKSPLVSNRWALLTLMKAEGKTVSVPKEMLSDICNNNDRALKLIEEVFQDDGGQIDVSYATTLNKKDVDIWELIQHVLSDVEADAVKKKVVVTIKEPEESLPLLSADPNKVVYVLENIIDNAIRYSEQSGEVTVQPTLENGSIVVAVTDAGIGIPKDEQGRIFEKSFRARNAQKRAPEGNGFGLFIAKNIVEAHGGSIWFESTEGTGTTFWVSLPLE